MCATRREIVAENAAAGTRVAEKKPLRAIHAHEHAQSATVMHTFSKRRTSRLRVTSVVSGEMDTTQEVRTTEKIRF